MTNFIKVGSNVFNIKEIKELYISDRIDDDLIRISMGWRNYLIRYGKPEGVLYTERDGYTECEITISLDRWAKLKNTLEKQCGYIVI